MLDVNMKSEDMKSELINLNLTTYYLGNPVKLYQSLETYVKTEFVFENGFLILHLDAKSALDVSETLINATLQTFLYRQCKRTIEKRVLYFQKYFKLKPRKITIEKSYNKWGTCNSARELTFNYVLITKSPDAIDYVVVHELCHLMHLNHDRSFWRLLGSILPNYKEVEKKLSGLER